MSRGFISFALWSLMIQVFYVYAPEIRAAGLAPVFSLWVILTGLVLVMILAQLSEVAEGA